MIWIFFDEFVEHHEFDLALHLACDHQLMADSSRPDLRTIQLIQTLHQLMSMEDDSLEKLQASEVRH